MFSDEVGRNACARRGGQGGRGVDLASGRRERACGLNLPLDTQDSDYVVAVRNFLPEDPSLLAFHKGDIIHLQPPEPPRLGRCLGVGGH